MTDNLKEFTRACFDALYFTETGEGDDQPKSNAKVDKEARLDLNADCRSWWKRFGCYVLADSCICTRGSERYTKAGQAGHDFWLTRNGHGAGFWDGDWSENYADLLSKGAEAYGKVDVFDDGGKINF